MCYRNESKQDRAKSIFLMVVLLVPLLMSGGCASNAGKAGQVQQVSGQDHPVQVDTESSKAASAGSVSSDNTAKENQPYRPDISWKPSYALHDVKIKKGSSEEKLPFMTVGADMKSRFGKVPLITVIKNLADLKDMNVSWTSDVDQNARVDVDIKADDDFWAALDNVLRQLDYFYEFRRNTIIVKYKETRRFHVTCPFVTGSYQTSAGGDFLGSSDAIDNYHGALQLDHNDPEIDIWQNIENNIARILQLSTRQVAETATGPSEEDLARIRQLCAQQFPGDQAQQALCVQQNQARLELQNQPGGGQNNQGQQQSASAGATSNGNDDGVFYVIDKPLGIITVTAPRSLMEQVDAYITNLNKELSRQVMIEAKIVEVRLNNHNYRGIDWSGLLKSHELTFQTTFGDSGLIFDGGWTHFMDSISMTNDAFSIVLNFLDEFGDVTVLSNPKVSLMNGQPGVITGGKTRRYIDRVTSNINNSGTGSITTYNVETRDIFEGVGMGVMANIAENGEIILQLTPVSTKLDGEIEYKSFGTAQVGLPKVYLRQTTTMARVKDGQMLVLGGIIVDEKGTTGNKVPLLGDIPYLGYLFKSETKYHQKVEMVLMLIPHIVEI